MKKNKNWFGIIATTLIIFLVAGVIYYFIPDKPFAESCISTDIKPTCSSDTELKSCINNKYVESKCFYGCNEGSCCQADYSDVLLITNDKSQVSLAIGQYFMDKRNVTNNLVISVTESENINFATFNSSVIIPLHNYLVAHPNIKYLVTTKGVPLRVTNTCETLYGSSLSFDNMLAAQYKYYGTSVCDGYFGNNYGESGSKVIPVTRLDGYTYDDAINLITPRVCNNWNGLILLDQKGNGDYHDPWITTTYSDIVSNYPEHAIILESTTKFIKNKGNIDGYVSWGSNDGSAGSSNWNLSFNKGSIADTWVSTGARSMTPGTTYGQSLIADLTKNGLSGVSGYVNEPGIQAVEDSYLISNYLSGKNLADSFYLSMPTVGWQSLVLGDPKLYVVEGGKKDSCSGIKCTNSCLNSNTLSYNGLCDGYGTCQFKNMTCQYGCSNGICNTPPSCSPLGSNTCAGEIVATYCASRQFYNGFEYVPQYVTINLTTGKTRTPADANCQSSYFYCINGAPQCISSTTIKSAMTPVIAPNGNKYVFVGNWINQTAMYDNDPKTYAVADITTGKASVYINYTFTQKATTIQWKIYHDKGNYTISGGEPMFGKNIGTSTIQLRIDVEKTSTSYYTRFYYYDGQYWKYYCLDCMGSQPFNLNTNKIYDEEIVGLYLPECYPNTVNPTNAAQRCGADYRWH